MREDLIIAAYLLLRCAVGSFFLLSGYHKLFNAARHKSLVDTLTTDKIPDQRLMQWLIPMGELCGGIGVVTGTLTSLASLGLLIICLGATATDGLKRIPAWHPIDKGDYVDDVLYLPELIYALMLLYIIAIGAGPISVDWLLGIN